MITTEMIQTAIDQTLDRWERLAKAKSFNEVKKVWYSTKCGFCKLDDSVNFGCYYCPIGKGCEIMTICCKEYNNAKFAKTIETQRRWAQELVDRVRAFNAGEIATELNKVIQQ